MVYFWIALAVIPSPILIFISCEAIAIIWALKDCSSLALAASLALGQTIGFTLLCVFGGQLAERWERVKKLRERADLPLYQRHAPKLVAWASFVGVPPVNISCIAAATVKARVSLLVPLLFTGRFARYWIIASLPDVFADYVNPSLLPQWILQL